MVRFKRGPVLTPSRPALWVLRHAKPMVEPGVCYGRLDVPADSRHTWGAATAMLRHWHDSGTPAPSHIWCSPLHRTRQMAEALQAMGCTAPVCLTPALAEMDFGDWEGRRWDDIGERDITGWTEQFWSNRPGGGESVQMFMARVNAVWLQTQTHLASLAEVIPAPQGLWITHAGVCRALAVLQAQGFNRPLQAGEWPAAAPEPGGWIRIDADSRMPLQTQK